MKISIGSDHGGYELKQKLIAFLKAAGHEVVDCGADNGTISVDYPDFALAACQKVVSGETERAVVCCGSGIGISIAANKVNGIRCALCHSEYDAEMARKHNNANVIGFGARTTGDQLVEAMLKRFLTTDFEGGRHANRVAKITKIEEMQK